jgi:photosystem II stability/assembly factor-like uncharacterized protein
MLTSKVIRHTSARSVLLIVFLSLVAVSDVAGQYSSHWKAINATSNLRPRATYFINPDFGFVFLPLSAVFRGFYPYNPPSLLRTLDGGRTWDPILYFNDHQISLAQIFFTSATRGFAVGSSDSAGGIFETSDRGTNWREVGPSNVAFSSIYVVDGAIFATSWTDDNTDRLYMSQDDGRSWTTILLPKMLSYGLRDLATIVGNRDSLIEVFFAQDYVSYILVSTDQGRSWSTSRADSAQYPQRSLFQSPHSRRLFSIQVNRSDLFADIYGLYKDSVEPTKRSRVLRWETGGWLAGVDCAMYVCDGSKDSSLLRSTDGGETWQEIPGPQVIEVDDWDRRNICVVGGGAVIYCVDNSGTLYKSEDGGDGKISLRDYNSLWANTNPAPGQLPAVSFCDSTLIGISQHAPGCQSWHFKEMKIVGLNPSEFSIRVFLSTTLPFSDSESLVIRPNIGPSRTFQVTTSFANDDFVVADTTFTFTQPSVITSKDQLKFHPAALDFGSRRLCELPTKDSINLEIGGCGGYVDSVWILPSEDSKDFSIPKGTLSLHYPDSSGYIVCFFRPSRFAAERARIVVKSTAGLDTLILKGSGSPAGTDLVFGLDTILSVGCSTGTGTMTISNVGCTLMVLDSLILLGAFDAPQSQLSFGLPLGQSQQVSVNFVPQHFGLDSSRCRAVFRLVYGSNILHFDTTVMVYGRAGRGGALLTLVDSMIDFGDVLICGSKSLMAHLVGRGCDSLSLAACSLSDHGFSAVKSATTIASGSSDSISILFVPPTLGSFTSSITIATNGGTKTIMLKGNGVPGLGRVLLSNLSLSLPQVVANCDSSSAVMRFQNGGCSVVTVDSISSAPTPFYASRISNILLQPDSSVSLSVKYVPHQIGPSSGTVIIHYHSLDNIEHDTSVSLSATAVAPSSLKLALQQLSLSTEAGKSVDIPINISGTLDAMTAASLALQTITLTLKMNTDLLTPQYFTSASNTRISVSNVKGSVNVVVPIPSGQTITTTQSLGSLHCIAYVTDTMTTDIAFASADFKGNGSLSCFTSEISPVKSHFQLSPICSDSILMNAMAHRFPFAIEAITPNPTSGRLTIIADQISKASIEYQLFNELGKELKRGTLFEHSSEIDIHDQQAGAYFLRFESAGKVETRKVVLLR